MTQRSSSAFEYTFITRSHVLLTGVVTTAAALLFLLPNFPLPVGFLGVCIASVIFHLVLFVIFNRATPLVFTIANLINLFMLAMAVHYTGGILSPFTMVFPLVLISGAGYGVRLPVALGASIGFYCGIIIAEKQGYLPIAHLTAHEIYASWPATLLVLCSVVAFMSSSGSIYKVTVNKLRQKIAQELELKQTIKNRLAQLDAPSQVGLLVHKIVHDVSGPLGAVSSLIELLKEEPSLPPSGKEDCGVAVQELSRVNQLLGRMVQYVKPGQTEREELCASSLIGAVLTVIAFLPTAADIEFVRELPPPGTLRIHANKQELQQVFFNVLKNAVEAFPTIGSQKTIRTSIERQGDAVVITVSDNGPGFSQDLLRNVGREMVSTKPQGSGIGLIIAREIIEAHGGNLTLKNRETGGASVIASLPIHKISQKELHEKTNRR